MQNSRLDFEKILSHNYTRKVKKGKVEKYKYLNRPYPSIKGIRSIK